MMMVFLSERRSAWFKMPMSGQATLGQIRMSRLHLNLKSRKHTPAGILIHELAHQLLGHTKIDSKNWQKREVVPHCDWDEGGPSMEAWTLFVEVEADIVTEECLRTLRFPDEADLRKRRIEAHFLIDHAKTFDEVAPQVIGVGPLLRIMGHWVLPKYDKIRSNPTLARASATIVEAVRHGQLRLS
jgi:hypothetical protein